MPICPNFTNANATTSFAGGASGGASFPNGVTIGNNPPVSLDSFGIFGSEPLASIDPTTGDLTDFQASAFHAGEPNVGYITVEATGMSYSAPSTGINTNFLLVGTSGAVNQYAFTNISTINGVVPGASIPYISSINLSALFPSGLNAAAKGFASTIMSGMPTGSTIQAQMDIEVDAPGGSNVTGTLWAGMGTVTGGISFFTPVYFNTANPTNPTVVSMTGLINIPQANDGLVLALSNGSTGGLLPVEALGTKVSLVSV